MPKLYVSHNLDNPWCDISKLNSDLTSLHQGPLNKLSKCLYDGSEKMMNGENTI